MAKISKNQRTNRGPDASTRDMARVILAEKNEKGHYSFRQKMVDASKVQDEIKAARDRNKA